MDMAPPTVPELVDEAALGRAIAVMQALIFILCVARVRAQGAHSALGFEGTLARDLAVALGFVLLTKALGLRTNGA